MNFCERLKKARIDRGLKQAQVCEFFRGKGYHVQPYTLSNWENGKRKPDIEEFALLCECYKVRDALSLLTGKPSRPKYDPLLEGLNKKGRLHALKLLELLKNEPVFTEEEKPKAIRTYRLYDIPVSAGAGMFFDSDGYEEVAGDDTVPEDTDYAVRISGNSMEPKYKDGQILFIREQSTLNEGEIGIFALNGESYVKKLIKNTLVSLNPVYKPIRLRESDDFRVLGKVVGAL